MCNIAGPLSDAVLSAMAPQNRRQLTQCSAAAPRPVFLMRQRGCADVVTQLTRELRVDASLEVWSTVMSGELACASAIRGAWLPSVTAWRFQAGFVPNFALEFTWPTSRPVIEWHGSQRAHDADDDAMSTTAAVQNAVNRCKLLSKRVHTSMALEAIERSLPPSLTDAHLLKELRRTFPQLRMSAISARATLSQLILHFQCNRSRMREPDADAFGVFFLAVGVSDLASRDQPPPEVAPHGDARKPCTCSHLASFLSTYSNRISLPASTNSMPTFDADADAQNADDATRRETHRRQTTTDQWRRRVATLTANRSGADRVARTRNEASTFVHAPCLSTLRRRRRRRRI